MILDIFRSLSGDCLLITSKDGKRILADAGLPDAYSEYVATAMGKLRDEGHDIDVAYISHIDRDHIGGILRMLDDEVRWRAHEFKLSKGRKSKPPGHHARQGSGKFGTMPSWKRSPRPTLLI